MSRSQVIGFCCTAALAFLCFSACFGIFGKGFVSSINYSRIEEGMTLEEVEKLLGPGEELLRRQLPGTNSVDDPDPKRRGTSVVGGDRFFQWPWGYSRGARIIVGFVEDKVWDKYWWEPMP